LVVLELFTNLVLETVLYAGAAGVSQVALLVSVAFWTWLWGPLGLLMATPLTVCLVVLGKNVPGLEFVGTLMADTPALAPEYGYYQRLLARDQAEAADLIERHIKTESARSVYDALLLMAEHNVGALVVVENGEVIGVLTERDYSRKVVLHNRTSRDTLVGDIISRPAITVSSDERIETCMEIMTNKRIRHLPVVDDGSLTGMISIGDLVNWVMHSQRHTIQQLHGYISGEYPG
jgi:predicted transcriptional regulator